MLNSSVSSKNVLEILESSVTFLVYMQIAYSSLFSTTDVFLRNAYKQWFENLYKGLRSYRFNASI